jgi:cysteine dioxygenase
MAPLMTLQVYTPPNAAMRGCHLYDEHDGKARHVMQGAYDSIHGVVPAVEK